MIVERCQGVDRDFLVCLCPVDLKWAGPLFVCGRCGIDGPGGPCGVGGGAASDADESDRRTSDEHCPSVQGSRGRSLKCHVLSVLGRKGPRDDRSDAGHRCRVPTIKVVTPGPGRQRRQHTERGRSGTGELSEHSDEITQLSGDTIDPGLAGVDPVVRDDRGAAAVRCLFELGDVERRKMILCEADV